MKQSEKGARAFSAVVVAWVLLRGGPALAVSLSLPQQFEVFQRSSAQSGLIYVQGTCSPKSSFVTITVADPTGKVIGGGPIQASGGSFKGSVTVPAGGWYTVSADEGQNGPAITVPTVGVGEVFLSAGQSNSVQTGESPQPSGPLVSAGNLTVGPGGSSPAIQWSKEIDPGTPYVVDYQHFGSPWSSFATEISQATGVPVTVIPVGCGGTRITQWLPPESPSNPPDLSNGCATSAIHWIVLPPTPGNLYNRLLQAAQALQPIGSFRAVLWHQGESDAINIFEHLVNPPGAVPGGVIDRYGYNSALTTLVHQLNSDLGKPVTWVIANASYFPSSDVNPAANCTLTGTGIPANVQKSMNEVIQGQNLAIQQGLVLQGPNTDQFAGSPLRYEGNDNGTILGACIHFSTLGVAMHGAYWAASVLATGIVPTGFAPSGGTQSVQLVTAASNDQLSGWAASSVVNPGPGNIFSTAIFPSWDNTRTSYLAAWLPTASWISEVDLQARMAGGKALGFPTFYDLYLTAPDNSGWNFVGQYGSQPGPSGVVRIPLVESFYTYGVMIVPRALGVDNNGSYFFQLAGIKVLH